MEQSTGFHPPSITTQFITSITSLAVQECHRKTIISSRPQENKNASSITEQQQYKILNLKQIKNRNNNSQHICNSPNHIIN